MSARDLLDELDYDPEDIDITVTEDEDLIVEGELLEDF